MKRLIRKAVKTVTVEELFREKYPNGNITKKPGGKYDVVFKSGEKVYSYRAQNNIDIIKKLNLTNENVMYQHTYDSIMEQIESDKRMIQKYKDGTAYQNDFFDMDDMTDEEKVEDTKKQLEMLQYDLKCFEEKAKNAVIVK